MVFARIKRFWHCLLKTEGSFLSGKVEAHQALTCGVFILGICVWAHSVDCSCGKNFYREKNFNPEYPKHWLSI